MNAKEFFNREILVGDNWDNEKHVTEAITTIKKEWDIETSRKELLVEVSRKAVPVNKSKKSKTFTYEYVLTIKPAQELLRKFEKEYPEMII